MIKKWKDFLLEFVSNYDSVIDIKMQEIKDLIDNISDKSIIYEWENNQDHQLNVSFSFDSLSIKYEFDIDELKISKVAGERIDFEVNVESIDEGLEVIEKDIQSILGISEHFSGEWSSSLRWEDVEEIMSKIIKISEISEKEGFYESEDLISIIEKELSPYDKIVVEFIVDSLLFCEYSKKWMIDNKIEEIIRLGDRVMSNFGTEPRQVLNAYDWAFRVIGRYYDIEEDEEIIESRKAKPRAQRYKGKKIPGKYLTKNPGKMKKEIDTYRGKKEYKKDWDADYTSGKGGQGKRVKTKKSAATLAYERMYKNKEK